MDLRESTQTPDGSDGMPDSARRSFIGRAGAGLSALLVAMVPGVAGAAKNGDKELKATIDRLSGEVGILQDENNVRSLCQHYENLLDRGMYEDAVGLFTDDGEVVFNGGLFKGKRTGVNRLYCHLFRSGLTGKKIEYIPGILPDIGEHHDMIEVMPDRKSARAGFTYSIQVGTPVVSDSALVGMARLHGEGIMKWWEGGTCYISCVKDPGDGSWKIKSVEYRTVSKAGYRPGRSWAGPMSVACFSKVFPEDPAGPDRLVKPAMEL